MDSYFIILQGHFRINSNRKNPNFFFDVNHKQIELFNTQNQLDLLKFDYPVFILSFQFVKFQKSVAMRYLLLFVLQIILISQGSSQNIASFFNQFNTDSLVKTVRELSGEDSVIVNGTKTIIKNRAAYLGYNLTEEYLKARLAGYQLTVQTQKNSINGLNVFGIQEGTKYPDQVFIIGAHHDAVTNYCADDNASGCAAVMETARILSQNKFEYTLIYTFWDEEEAGLWGSTYHAKQSNTYGQIFKGIIVMDMIGYDSNNDRKFDIHVNNNPSCLCLADSVINIINRYQLNLDPQIINPGSDRGDHYSYWRQGINNAIGYGERIFTDDPNPAYHTENDRIDIFNIPYFAEISKMTVGLMASLAKPVLTVNSDKPELLATEFYPNPTNGKLRIKVENNILTNLQVSDIFGRLLLEKRIEQPNFMIDLKDFSDGIYLVSISGKKEKVTRKIIISH